MSFTVSFGRRDLSGGVVALPAVELEVERLEWRAVGGPWAAKLLARASSLERLWGLVDLLRCEMVISDEEGAAWWGYVSAVGIHPRGGQGLRLSLDGMWNKVKVLYHDDSPNPVGGVENLTAWYSDPGSVRAWGAKELLVELGVGSAADAAAYAASVLAKRSRPQITPAGEAGKGDWYVVIEGRGWWETLDWQYYSQARGQAGDLHGGASLNFGTSSAAKKVAQLLICSGGTWLASEVWVKLKRYLATDSVKLSICANNSGAPGAVEASATVAASAMEDEITWVKAALSPPVIAGGSMKWIVLERTGSLSDANYYVASVDQGLKYVGSYLIQYVGSSWGYRTPDADLSVLAVGVEDTGTQVNDIISGSQFISRCRLEGLSGINGRLYREGKERTREEAEKLLKMGQSAGGENLVFVDRGRAARVYAKPGSGTARYQVGVGKRILRPDGRPAPASQQPAGSWARLGELSGAGRWLGYEAVVWLGRVVWEKGELRAGEGEE